MTRAVTINVNGQVAEITLSTPPKLDELQRLVGGYIEAVPLRNCDTMYLNEEGKLHGLAVNVIATELTRGIVADDDLICGDVVILGPVDDDGNDTDARTPVVKS